MPKDESWSCDGYHRDLARQLLALAVENAMAAREMVGVRSVTDAIVGFHAQQAVEKAMKAVLAFADHEFPFTHNLAQLEALCTDSGHPLPQALAEVDRLTPYEVRLRYGAEDLGRVEREMARDWASGAVVWAEGILRA